MKSEKNKVQETGAKILQQGVYFYLIVGSRNWLHFVFRFLESTNFCKEEFLETGFFLIVSKVPIGDSSSPRV